MAVNQHSLETSARATEITDDYRVIDGIYLLGSLARGLTVFDQQVRAHNLAWALWRTLEGERDVPTQQIAVVGGGIAGLTLAACLLARSRSSHVTLFEERWDLCPLQQGADTRWVHPHIYHWPEHGSRAPDAGLPVLNWTEGRASDISREVLEGFGRYANEYGAGRLDLYLGLSHLRVDAASRTIEWMGRKGDLRGAHVRSGDPHGTRSQYDAIVLATGFGLEVEAEPSDGMGSYWRNDRLGQPQLSGGKRTFLISGYGDGAIIDLCRLTIERFRQDTILYELFGAGLESLEVELRSLLRGDFGRTASNVYDLLENSLSEDSQSCVEAARIQLLGRLREDTTIILHASGRAVGNASLRDLFGPHSSFLNRVLLYLLYRCGGFVLSLDDLETAKRNFDVQETHVVRRYGADTLKAVRALFSDPTTVGDRLMEMASGKIQLAERKWPLGAFPHLPLASR